MNKMESDIYLEIRTPLLKALVIAVAIVALLLLQLFAQPRIAVKN